MDKRIFYSKKTFFYFIIILTALLLFSFFLRNVLSAISSSWMGFPFKVSESYYPYRTFYPINFFLNVFIYYLGGLATAWVDYKVQSEEEPDPVNKFIPVATMVLIGLFALLPYLGQTTIRGAPAPAVNKPKADAADCAYLLEDRGKEIGTPNESICDDICSEYKENNFQITDEAKNKGIENAYQACIAGKPEWIVNP